ncbi:MAG: cobalamin biosynthesis protein CobQ [Pseudomonadota bacterium]
MQTPTHLLVAAACFARPGQKKRNAASLIGAFLPDASLYFMVLLNGVIRGFPMERVFGESYFHPFWQRVFAIDNSVFVWLFCLILGAVFRSAIAVVFACAGLLHILFDFPLHHDDGRAHFWPLSDWIFESPVSYWDPQAYGWFVAPVELALGVVLIVLLLRRFKGIFARTALLAGLSALVLPQLAFLLMFG